MIRGIPRLDQETGIDNLASALSSALAPYSQCQVLASPAEVLRGGIRQSDENCGSWGEEEEVSNLPTHPSEILRHNVKIWGAAKIQTKKLATQNMRQNATHSHSIASFLVFFPCQLRAQWYLPATMVMMRMARVIWHYEARSGDSECFQAPCRVGSTPKTMMTPRLTKNTVNWSRCCCQHPASTTIPSLVLKLTLLSVNMSSIQFSFLGCEICKWTCHLTVGHIQHLVLKNLYRRPSPDLCCPVVTVTSTGSASQDQALYMGDYQRWKYDVAEWNGIICDKKLKLSFVAGCRITTMNDLPIGNLYVMMLITIIKGSWLWNASDHDVENENDWHCQARGRREPVYLLLHQQGG